MQEESRNYGRPGEPGDETGGGPQGPSPFGQTDRPAGGRTFGSEMSPQDERTWSMISHLSVLAGLIGLMPLGALIVWLIYKDKSPRVGFHAAQALWYQIAWLAIWIVGSIIGVIFTIVTFGIGVILVVPLGLLLWLAPLVHGSYAAYKVNQGVDYRYPFIADKVDGGARRTV